jgi:hypothetical protein
MVAPVDFEHETSSVDVKFERYDKTQKKEVAVQVRYFQGE